MPARRRSRWATSGSASTRRSPAPAARSPLDGTALTAPYTVSAIGDPPTLAAALAIPGGVFDTVRRAGGTMDVEQSDVGDRSTPCEPPRRPPLYARPAPGRPIRAVRRRADAHAVTATLRPEGPAIVIPEDLRYSSDHEWIRTLDGDADTENTGGITGRPDRHHRLRAELAGRHRLRPDAGAGHDHRARRFDRRGRVHQVRVGHLRAGQRHGRRRATTRWTRAPELVNSDPYGDGWMIEVELADPAQLDDLLDAAGLRGDDRRGLSPPGDRGDLRCRATVRRRERHGTVVRTGDPGADGRSRRSDRDGLRRSGDTGTAQVERPAWRARADTKE